MNKALLLLISLATIFSCSEKSQENNSVSTEEGKETHTTKPNIIFIYADDLGYGDLSANGQEQFSTPYIDQMAKEGANFTSFYSCSPVCTPSRAGFITGRYPVRSGLTRVLFPNSLEGLDKEEVTIAELLKEQGYATGLVGKWHLGCLPEFMPNQHGFDYYFGLPYSNDMEWEPRNDPPTPLYRNDKIIAQPVHQNTLTQRYTAEAKNFIYEHKDQPFFLYFPHTFPHKPLNVSAEYAGSSAWGLYGDVVQELDRSVGEVIALLRELKLDKNTIVVFSSDNGPAGSFKGPGKPGMHGFTGGLRGHKATCFEGGIVVPTVAWWPETIPGGQTISNPAIMMDWYATFAELGGAKVPEDRVVDGENILPMLTEGKKRSKEEFYFYYNEELRAIRSGDFKLKIPFEGNERKGRKSHDYILTNLIEDQAESNNLYASHKEKADELENKMKSFLDNLGEVPSPKIKEVPFDDPRKKK